MVERGTDPRLAAESREGVLGGVGGQDLERDLAAQHLVPGEVHARHPAAAESPLQPIAAGEEVSVGVVHGGHCDVPGGIRCRVQNGVPMKVVMGIDPGAANLGFGVVRVEGAHMVALDGGVVETGADLPIERRLDRIHRALAELIEWHEPKAVAIEDLYFGRNVRSAMAVGQASGIAMLAAAQRGIRCFTYTPQAIKMAVCGSGSAGKRQVQKMVGTLLGLPEAP